MNRSNSLRRLVPIAVCALLLLGAKGTCGGVFGPKALCENTGGTWNEGDCPPSCWPPECGQSLQACAPGCGSEPVCSCPAAKPFWRDGEGCWSEAECKMTCQGSATSCFMEMIGCTFQDGCHEDCDTDSSGHEDCDCHGFARDCDTYDDPGSCRAQDGCDWK